MRKILLLIMLLNCLFIVGCEQSNTYQDNGDIKIENSDYAKDDLVYSEYSEGFSTFNPYLFYKIDSYEKYMQISRVYRMKKKDFDERYFYEKGLVIFVVSESSGSYRHELQLYFPTESCKKPSKVQPLRHCYSYKFEVLPI